MSTRAWVLLRLVGLVTVAMAALASPLTAGAEAATVTRDTTYDFYVDNPCTGERLHILGTVHAVLRFDIGPSGQLHFVSVENFDDVTVTGETSGLVYNPTGQPGQFIVNQSLVGDNASLTLVNRQLFITESDEENLIVKRVLRIVVTATGELSVEFDRISVECRG